MKPADHPDDARLVSRYFDEAGADDELELHLFRCALCAGRWEAITATLDADYERMRRAADAAFTPERLDQQRASILAQLDTPRRGRVLPFPGDPPGAAAGTAPLRRARLAAVAAILAMVGAGGAGFVLEVQRQDARLAGSAPATAVLMGSSAAHDDLLSDIDLALASPGTPELRVLDALTPHAFEPASGR